MPKVECDIENCKYNRDGECMADVISLWAYHICDGGCDSIPPTVIGEETEDVEIH